jgi:topoisomerase-4 subunit A
MLLTQTSMESSVPINLVCIGTDGRPGQRSLRRVLTEWLEFRAHTMTRRTRYRLDKVTDRIHVLEGRMVVYLNVDEVIQTIRESDEPRQALMQRFDLTERQAEDILEMRLRQLARLEGFKIEKELAAQRDEQAALQELLDNPRAFKRLMIKEIESDAKTYGDDRRTLIEAAERAVMEVKVVEEPVTVIISQKGWLRSRQGHGHDASQFGFKTGDSLYGAIECLSTDDLVAFSDRGRVYTVAVSSLPSARGDGQPVTSMIELEPGAHIVHMVAGDAARRFVLGTRSGYGFIATLGDLTTRQRSGKQFLTLDKGDVMLRPLPLRDQDSQLAMMARKGRFLVVELAELKKLSGGGRGTILMGLDSGDALDQWVSVGPQGLEVHGIYRNKQTVITLDAQALAEYVGKRARKGKLLDVKVKGARLHPAA